MKKTIILALFVTLTGCSTIGNYLDSQDACQYKGKPQGYVKPDFCKVAGGYYHAPSYIYNNSGRVVGNIR